jgi:hypothetical protein
MDPMLQLAKRFLTTELTFEREAWTHINNEIEYVIAEKDEKGNEQENPVEKDKVKRKLHVLLWKSRDERAQEILADVLYRRPEIARRLCEHKPDLCPEFVHYLVDEARKQWGSEKNGDGWPCQWKVRGLLTKPEYDINSKFPEALELCLIEKPRIMEDLSDSLSAALPFSWVLNKELNEVRRSRDRRLGDDYDASAAPVMKDILRRFTSRDRLVSSNGREDERKNKKDEDILTTIDEQLGELEVLEKQISRGGSDGSDGRPATEQERKEKEQKEKEQKEKETLRRYPPAEAEAMSLFGLALSGGGIRSATFNLGILQGMADLDLLRRLDYLSGVSGGSHIAGWLTAWTKRTQDGIRKVQRWLSPTRSPVPDTLETQPIHFLRRFSNYLAPRRGFLSSDTWAMVSAWARNTMLNQLVFALLVSAVLGVPKIIFKMFDQSVWFRSHNGGWIGGFTIALLFLLAILIGLNLARFDHDPRPGRGERRRSSWLWEGSGVQSTVVAGLLVLGLLGSSELLWLAAPPVEQPPWLPAYFIIFGALLTAQLCGRSWRCFYSERPEETTVWQKIKSFSWMAASSATSSFLAWAMLYGIYQYSLRHPPWPAGQEWPQPIRDQALAKTLVVGPAVLMGVLSLAMIFQLGLMGRNLPDSRREWWSRLGAKLSLTLGLWIALSFSGLFGPWLVLVLREWMNAHTFTQIVLVAVIPWVAITILGFQWGLSARTGPFPSEDSGALKRFGSWSWRLRAGIGEIAPYFYIAGLAIALSFLQYALTAQTMDRLPKANEYWSRPEILFGPWWLWLWLPLALFTLALLLAWRFDVNEFSMRNLYANRLVRCYLGASRTGKVHGRNPNPFTGFDPQDDMDLADLLVEPPHPYDLARAGGPYWGPFPIINTALNLVAGKELAWQERKAASFAFTPLYSGYECTLGTNHSRRELANYGYRPTVDYARPKHHGLSLGTCMAISGAAVNPNMGYHSSPAISFLMALFNVRLGCWLGNTRHRKTWTKWSPEVGLIYLINELIGRTNDTSRYVNLSDGGHFENLGLYELVRRRCKYIIVSDAEEDSTFSFNGLGNAIRKCRTDFGVDIRMNPDQLRPVLESGRKHGRSRSHCAVGDIIYSPETRGKLLYIKTTLTGDEPGDVLEYKLCHPDFPHQSTANQFFDESQFESYRELGQHIAVVILMRAVQSVSESRAAQEVTAKADGKKADCSSDAKATAQERFLGRLFRYLHAMWYPRPHEMETKGKEHSTKYDHLVRRFEEQFAEPIDGEIAEKMVQSFFRDPDGRGKWRPEPGFFLHTRMIELMHSVFEDLKLETMAEHPHNEGWMNMFREWAKENPRFRQTWEVLRVNYDIRFRSFCEKEFFLPKRRRSSHVSAKNEAPQTSGPEGKGDP